MNEHLQPLIDRHGVAISTAWMERGGALLTQMAGELSIEFAASSDVAERNVALAVLLEAVELGLPGLQHRFIAQPAGHGLDAMYRRYWVPLIHGLRRLVPAEKLQAAEREGWEDFGRAAEEWDVPIEFVRIRLQDWRVDLLAEVRQRIRSLDEHRKRSPAVRVSFEPPPPDEPAILSSGRADPPSPERRETEVGRQVQAYYRAWSAWDAATRRGEKLPPPSWADVAGAQPVHGAPPPRAPRVDREAPPARPPSVIYAQGVPEDAPPPEAPASEATNWGRRAHVLKTRAIQYNYNETERLIGQDGDGI